MKWQLQAFENNCVLYQLIHFGNAKLWSGITTEPSPIGILLSKDKMKLCNINWHFWVHCTVWFFKLLFSSGFLKTRSFVSWPNKNLLTQCWNHKQRKTILALGYENICLEKENSESFCKLKDKVCCSETVNSRPRWFKWALYPQMLPFPSYGFRYSHTCSMLIVWWQNPITKFIMGLWSRCLAIKVIMIKRCPWRSLDACAHIHESPRGTKLPFKSARFCGKPALILAIQSLIHLI